MTEKLKTLLHEQVETGGRPGSPGGMVDRVLDGDAHVREAQLGLDGAVHELDERVDEALGMDDDIDAVVLHIV